MPIHWMMAFFEPVDMKMVSYAKKLAKSTIIVNEIPNNFQKSDNNYIIKGVEVIGYSVKDIKTDSGYEDRGAVYFRVGTKVMQLGLSYYPSLRFSIPKSQLKKYETEELEILQDIEITEWAFFNCYMLSVNKVYESWGRMMKSLLDAYDTTNWDSVPMYKYSPYRDIIQKLYSEKFKEMMENIKKKKGDIMEDGNDNKPEMVHKKRNQTTVQSETKPVIQNNHKNNGNNNAIRKNAKNHKKVNKVNHEPFREEADWIFYVDGSGNLAKEVKVRPFGHYSVFLKNTEEKWKKSEEAITSNQAEIMGTMSAIAIAIKRKYKNVIVFTDSKNVVNWLNKKPDSDEYIYTARHPNIINIVERCRELMKQVPNLTVKFISRDYNYAHAV